MTYNVKQCTVAGARGAVDRLADVVAAAAPDVLALQEVAICDPRFDLVHQAERLAERVGMSAWFETAMCRGGGGEYGIALLSRRPLRRMRGGRLPAAPGQERREPRVAAWVAVPLADAPPTGAGNGQPAPGAAAELHVIATHLGLSRRERHAQVEALLGPEWLGHPQCAEPRVLLGDLNLVPGSAGHRRLASVLRDALAETAPERGHRATFPSLRPLVRLDHVLVGGLRVVRTEVLRAIGLHRVSDHLPLVVDVEVTAAASGRGAPTGETPARAERMS